MKPNQSYENWKKELRIWEVTNLAIGIEKKIQAGSLFQALEGILRQIVLSELTVEQIIDEEGVDNILQILDFFYLGNDNQNAYDVIDDLLNFRCTPDLSLENFIMEFQLKANRVKATGTILSDDMLGYALLKSANLSNNKVDLIKATCNVLTYKNVKYQIQKIGLKHKSSSRKCLTSKDNASNVKAEQYFCGNFAVHNSSHNDKKSNKATVCYAGKNNKQFDAGRRFKSNSTDRVRHVRSCSFCKQDHWLQDCPCAPVSIKNKVVFKSRNNKYNHKTLGLDAHNTLDTNVYDVALFTDSVGHFSFLLEETLDKAIVDTGCPHTVAGMV